MDNNELNKESQADKNIVDDKTYEPETSQISQENKIVYDDEDAGQAEKLKNADKQKMRKYITTIIVIVCIIVIAIWAAKGCESSFS